MRRVFGLIAVVFLGLCAFATAACTIMTAIVSVAFQSPLGAVALLAGTLVTIGLVTLMKRVAARMLSN